MAALTGHLRQLPRKPSFASRDYSRTYRLSRLVSVHGYLVFGIVASLAKANVVDRADEC